MTSALEIWPNSTNLAMKWSIWQPWFWLRTLEVDGNAGL